MTRLRPAVAPALLFILMGLTVLTACGGRRDVAGLFIYRENDLFMQSLTREIQARAMGSIALETHYGLDSQVIQNEQIEKMLGSGALLMIINPVDRISSHALIRKLAEHQVPVIFFNREPLPEDLHLWEQVWYVGAHAEQSGRMQAELVMELFGSDPQNLNRHDLNGDGVIQAVILKGQQGHQDAEIRTATVLEAFGDAGFAVEILAAETANWSRETGYEKMGGLLDDWGDSIELVISNNDAMAIGALSAMRQRGMFGDSNGNGVIDKGDKAWIPVVGIDGVPEAVVQIEQGFLYGTVLNDWETMAEAIVELGRSIILNRRGNEGARLSAQERYIWVDYKSFKLDDKANRR